MVLQPKQSTNAFCVSSGMSEVLHHEHIIEHSRLIRQTAIKKKHLYPSLYFPYLTDNRHNES
jgi:hypothetical protein